MEKDKHGIPVKWMIILHLSFLMNSFAGVASKMAGKSDFLSLPFFFFYGIELLLIMGFAVVWQQILKRMPLTYAITNKPITVVYALIWSVLIFHEKITLRMAVGSLIVIAGILVCVTGGENG